MAPSLIYCWRRLAREAGGSEALLLAVWLAPAVVSGLTPARMHVSEATSEAEWIDMI